MSDSENQGAKWECTDYGPLNGNATLYKRGPDYLSWSGGAARLNALEATITDLKAQLEMAEGKAALADITVGNDLTAIGGAS